MPRSAPGASTGLPWTSTVPEVAGCCGFSPAMSRRTVDFPHPDGPRIVTNSILFGMSSTTNDTFLMAVKPSSYVFVTRSNRTTDAGDGATPVDGAATFSRWAVDPGDTVGISPGSVFFGPMRKQPTLEPVQQPVDPVGEQPDHDEDREDMLGEATALARHEQIAQPMLRIHELGEHDIAEREAEQATQAVIDVRHRQRNEHLHDDLRRRRA